MSPRQANRNSQCRWAFWLLLGIFFSANQLLGANSFADLNPANGATNVPLYATLQWRPMQPTKNFRLYLGTNVSEVAAATTNAPEFLDEVWASPETSVERYAITLKPYTQYFWRVDSIDRAGAIDKSAVQSFTTSFDYLENIGSATGVCFSATDNMGAGLDTLQVIENPATNGYIGVYHSLVRGQFQIRLALSTNLLDWTFVRVLDLNGSMPAICFFPPGRGFFLAHEHWSLPHSKGTAQLHFIYYSNYDDLLAGKVARDFLAPFSAFHSAQLEGTPNFFDISSNADLIKVGFHYYSDKKVDQNARGALRGFFSEAPSWSAEPAIDINEALAERGAVGNIGDRDFGRLFGADYLLQEGQLTSGDFGSWRLWFYDYARSNSFELHPKTPKGSQSFSNGTWRWLVSPHGKPALVAAFYVFAKRSSGEAGEVVFYHEIETAAANLEVVPNGASNPRMYQLRWLSGAGATTHVMYLGTDAASVERANPNGPLCLGQLEKPHITLRTLVPNTRYYFRVDEGTADGQVTRGAVWHFTTSPGTL